MSTVYIDPYTIAYPSNLESEDGDKLEGYLESILIWRELKEMNWAELLVSGRSSDILIRYNNYPYWDDLKGILIKTGLGEFYQPRDIIDVVESILHFKSIEEKLDISDILFDQTDLDNEITEGLKVRPDLYIDEFKRMLAFMALNSHTTLEKTNFLVSRGIESKKILFKTEIYDCEFNSEENYTFPILLEGECNSCVHISDLFHNLNIPILWKEESEPENYNQLLNIFLYQRLLTMNLDPECIPQWKFGEEFLKSCRKLGFLHQEIKIQSLLRACADTILNHNLSATHALRKSEGGNSPQVTRNGDRAWRRDIDYEYHLHYWQTTNGPELASVVVHNDMIIPA